MIVKPEFNLICSNKLESKEFLTDSLTLKITDNKEVGFGKVLEKYATVSVDKCTISGNELNYEITVYANVVFVDLSGEIRTAFNVGKANKKAKIEGLTEQSKCLIFATTQSLTIDKMERQDITFELKYCLFGTIVNKTEENALVNADGLYVQREKINILSGARCLKTEITLESTEKLKEKVSLILSSKSKVCDYRATPLLDRIDIEGKCESAITYLAQEGDNRIITEKFVFPFKESVENVGQESVDEVLLYFLPTLTTTNAYLGDDESLEIKAKFDLQGLLMRETEQEVITQVFSKSCKFNLEREVVPTCNYTGRLFAAKREVYDVEVDQLNGVVAPLWERAKITSISENGDKIIVNTEITVSAILEVDGSYIHREFLIPCEVEVNSDGVLREYLPKVCVKNVDITCNNSIVNIETEVEVCLYAFYNDVAEIITKMEEGDKKSADYSAIIVFVAKGGEGELDLAEKVNLTPDEIKEQETLEFPLKKGQKIVLYRRR